MSCKAHINVTLDNDVVHWIDMFRGQTPRSTFINTILCKEYKIQKKKFDWESEENLADEDIKKGRVKKFKTTKDAFEWLDN